MKEESSKSVSAEKLREELRYIADEERELEKRFNVLGSLDEIVLILQGWMSGREISDSDRAFRLAYLLPQPDLLKLVPSILEWVGSDRYYPHPLRLLGMLSRGELKEVLVPEVFRCLREDSSLDYYSWWRYARLLYYLGFESDVRRIASLALVNPDPEIREMGEDMIYDLL